MRKVREPRSDGARDLDAFLRTTDQSVPVFCEKKGLNRLAVQRALGGDMHRVDVDLAFAIQAATDGKVVAERWRTCTVRADDERPKGKGKRPGDIPRRNGTEG